MKTPSPQIVIEPVGHINPVYWQGADGRIVGPGVVLYVAQVPNSSSTFWLCAEFQGLWRWISDRLLRSKRDFQQQGLTFCNCCGGWDFWRSEFVEAICRRCHPPASDFKGGTHAG